jgi:hypothetical protein
MPAGNTTIAFGTSPLTRDPIVAPAFDHRQVAANSWLPLEVEPPKWPAALELGKPIASGTAAADVTRSSGGRSRRRRCHRPVTRADGCASLGAGSRVALQRQDRVESVWAKDIKDASGKPLFMASR